MDRVFLDANVLFSAAYRPDAGLLRLWKLPRVRLVTSRYALEEARINLDSAEQVARLDRLTAGLEVIAAASDLPLPPDVLLPAKDRPILRAAIEARCSHLLTGDVTHFGPLYGRKVANVAVMRPADYLPKRR